MGKTHSIKLPCSDINMAFRSPFLFVLLSLLVVVKTEKQHLSCYSCISQGDDDTCLKRPESAGAKPTVKCSYKYCTVRRYESPNQEGVVTMFYRGCEDNPIPNGKNPSPDINVWGQSCDWDRCNTGDGLHPITPGGDGGDDRIIHVPGSGGRPTTLFPLLLLSVGTLILCSSSYSSSSLF